MAKTILTVDDKENVRTLIREYLTEEGFRVVTAENGQTALFVARQIVRDLRDLQWFTTALLITGVGFALLVIREQLTGEVLFFARETLSYSPSFRKVVSLMGNAAPMGLSIALTLPLGLVLTSHALFAPSPDGRKRLAQGLLVVAVGIVALGAYMTYNRASWLAVVIAVVVLAVYGNEIGAMVAGGPIKAGVESGRRGIGAGPGRQLRHCGLVRQPDGQSRVLRANCQPLASDHHCLIRAQPTSGRADQRAPGR